MTNKKQNDVKTFVTLKVKDGHAYDGEKIQATSWDEAEKIAKEKGIYVSGVLED